MSFKTLCQNCGVEYDMRRGYCPACSVKMEIRESIPPYRKSSMIGRVPFVMFGERWAVTEFRAMRADLAAWRVSHVETGSALPKSFGATVQEAKQKGIDELTQCGEEKIKAGIAKIKKMIEEAQS